MPIFDFVCKTPGCANQNIPRELMIKLDAPNPVCETCSRATAKALCAPKGIVKGSNTPCNQQFKNNL